MILGHPILRTYERVPTEGLILEYLFSGNALDTSGNNNHGVLSANPPTLTTDRKGNSNSAYSFNGTNNYIDTTNAITYGTGAFATSLWIKKAVNNFSVARMAISTAGYPGWYWQGRAGVNGLASHRTWDLSGPQNDITAGELNTEWYHVVVQRDGSGNKEMFLNNSSFGTSNDTGFNIGSTNPTRIGGWSSNFWNGSIDDVRIYNRILTTEEIATLYNE